MRLVALLSLATASLLDLAMAPYQGKETGETALLRQLLDDVKPGTVLLADRYYCTYWLVALALARGVEVVFRMHHLRDYDLCRGPQLGLDDHLAVWHKPQRPEGKERVGNRPDRWEPRCVKRRPKPYKLLKEPRNQARARLLGKQPC